MTDAVVLLVALTIFYGMSVLATKMVFAKEGGIDTKRLLVIAPLAPATMWIPIAIAIESDIPILWPLLFVAMLAASIWVVKRLSGLANFTIKQSALILVAVLWRFIALGIALKILMAIVAVLIVGPDLVTHWLGRKGLVQ